MSETGAKPGTIHTFYSYKGGVGRSMALANVAALLARWGRRVLVVDWDLEAPGIEKYFSKWITQMPSSTRGILDLVETCADQDPLDWREILISCEPPSGKRIDIISAGKNLTDEKGDDDYVRRLGAIKWSELFEQKRLGNYLERLRTEWRNEYEFILIDSRTGITDIGGICTIHLPDVLISFFTANTQSLLGIQDVMRRARLGHSSLPVDRHRLLAVPVPSRDESHNEYELAARWREESAKTLGDLFEDWVPRKANPVHVLDHLKIPYYAYWSFGERVPVLEQDDPDNPKNLAAAYQPLARLIMSGLNWEEARLGAHATEAARKHEAEAEAARTESLRLEELRDERLRAMERAKEFRTRLFQLISGFEMERSRNRTQARLLNLVLIFGCAGTLMLSTLVVLVKQGFGVPTMFQGMLANRELSDFLLFIALFVAMTVGASVASTFGRSAIKARIAADAVADLKRQESLFTTSFPGAEPLNELTRFVREIEESADTWSRRLAHAGRPERPAS